jgi:sulfur carrier protein
MKLTVNGSPHVHRGNGTVRALLREMKADTEHVAVLVNEQVISRSKFGSARLAENDVVEVLTYAGGG